MDWYRWFPVLYSNDTLDLNLEQDAIYRRLIDHYMTTRLPLPYHANALARICQISLEKWKENEIVVLEKFKKHGDKYHNKRCDIELDRQDSTSRKLSDAAKKAHEERKKKQQLPCLGITEVAIEERRGEVEEKIKKERGDKNAKKRLRDIPADWKPNERHIEKARTGLLFIAQEEEKFRNYHESKGSQFVSWDAAFHTWLGYAIDRNKPKVHKPTGHIQATGKSNAF